MNHFLNMVAEANKSKEQFDLNLQDLKASLNRTVVESTLEKSFNSDVLNKKEKFSFPKVLAYSIFLAIKEKPNTP